MREIKFRGMDANGIMRYGRLAQDRPGSTAYYSEYSQRIMFDDYSNIPVSNKSLTQFTGLFDKNGKEIYEGDIISQQHHDRSKMMKFETKNYEIKFQTMVETHGSYSCGFYADVFNILKNCEIIGNIFENPELL